MESDEILEDLIRQAVLHDGRLSSQRVQVSVREGLATLSGAVQTFNRKQAAEEIVSSIGGVRAVVNELEVQPLRPLPDQRVAENVRRALEVHADITKEAITVSVRGGEVTLDGTVGSHWERTLAEDVAVGTEGVRGICNLLRVDPPEQREDACLAREMETALSLAAGLDDAETRVALVSGTAILSGEVEVLWQKLRAASVARRFGVRQIRNEIQVRRREPNAASRERALP